MTFSGHNFGANPPFSDKEIAFKICTNPGLAQSSFQQLGPDDDNLGNNLFVI